MKCQFQTEGGEELTYVCLESVVPLKNVDSLMCPGFVLLVQTRAVLSVMIFSNTGRTWGGYRKGDLLYGLSSLVSTRPRLQNRVSCWIQKVMSKAEDGFKVAPTFLDPNRLEI